ncbi:MAG: hypothetical protein ACFFF4_04320 [Candidatus Thorarchaeota archaeon]
MACRTWHLWFGFIAFVSFSILYFWYSAFEFPHDFLLVTLGLVAALGSEIPDIDQIADRVFHHRDWFTHSPIPATFLFVLAYLYGDIFGIRLVTYLVCVFLVTNASHFFLDLWPVWKGSGDAEKGTLKGGALAPARWLIEGLTGAEIYSRLAGTYLIHLPFAIPEMKAKKKKGKIVIVEEMMKTLPTGQTRAWLVLSGIIILAYAVILANMTMHFLPF